MELLVKQSSCCPWRNSRQQQAYPDIIFFFFCNRCHDVVSLDNNSTTLFQGCLILLCSFKHFQLVLATKRDMYSYIISRALFFNIKINGTVSVDFCIIL